MYNCGQDRQLIWIDKILLLWETVRTWSERAADMCELQQASEAPHNIRNEELSNY
ncbi:unnamed protein product [Ectocarpus sp. CCAP 1310/34]|nr:unnamed protein product [Ectocarpus sp. CCAP 1310/34]